MKSLKKAAHIAVNLLLLAAFGTAAAAASPLFLPRGLAVDSKGNLWVANSGANNILMYTPTYALQKTKTITSNISNPTGVAFGPQGNLWVANYGTSNGGPTGSIAEYINGVQNTAATITDGILGPEGIAIDGSGDVWINMNFSNVAIYGPRYSYDYPIYPMKTLNTGTPTLGLAIAAGVVAYGDDFVVHMDSSAQILANGFIYDSVVIRNTGISVAIDSKGNVYIGNTDNSVQVFSKFSEYVLLQLSFTPYAMAIDNVRGRIYIANSDGNSISVYSTAGALLHVIQ